jgi:RNA-binding protein YlmH
MNEENLIIARAGDQLDRCRNNNFMTNTEFLDLHQQSAVRRAYGREPEVRFWGGYPEAERVIMLCLPDYLEEPDPEVFTVIRANIARKGGRTPEHRDYLGALTGLGIRREMTGDILVREDGADIIVLSEIADFILAEYGKAGRVELTVSAVPIQELSIPAREPQIITDTVASVRLDNVVASAFRVSRTRAVTMIRQGLVFVDHLESQKPDQKLEENSLISVRHKGRIRLTQIGGTSRKGRCHITLEKY